MKLLEPNRLQEMKNKERLIEIQSGAYLANKVDTLRTKIVEEEEKLNVLKEKTIPFYQAKVNELSEKYNTLVVQCSELGIKRDNLLQPINDRSHELDVREKKLEDEYSIIRNTQSQLTQVKRTLDTANRKLLVEQKKLDNRKQQYKDMTDKVTATVRDLQSRSEVLRLEEKKISDEWAKIENAKRELDEIRRGNEEIAAENKKEKNILKIERRKLSAQQLMYGNRRKQ